jgi:hypothetical protein
LRREVISINICNDTVLTVISNLRNTHEGPLQNSL